MIEQGKDYSQRDTGKIAELNYAPAAKTKQYRKIPITGIISIVAMLVQIPWSFPALHILALADYDPGPAGVKEPVPPLVVFFAWTIAFLPALIGLICGCYSVKVAGISWRNSFGVLGLTMALMMVAALCVLIAIVI